MHSFHIPWNTIKNTWRDRLLQKYGKLANYIINQKLQSSKRGDTAECEADRIVLMAEKIEIRKKEYDQSTYPTNKDIADIEKGKQWIPHHLQTLLKTLVISEMKHWACNSAIISDMISKK